MRAAIKNARFGAATPTQADSGCALADALNLMRFDCTPASARESRKIYV